jgi:hypothetical protein
MVTTPASTSSTGAPAAASLEVKTTVFEDRQTEEEVKARGYNTRCDFETDFPPNLLSGVVYVVVSEADAPGQPAKIIDSNEAWLVDVYWFLGGQVSQLICGQWSVKIFMESMGKDDLDLEIPPTGYRLPTNPSGFYHVRFYIPPNYVKVEANDGTPFSINVATALLTTNGRPSPIIGFCSLDPILFFYEGIEVTP